MWDGLSRKRAPLAVNVRQEGPNRDSNKACFCQGRSLHRRAGPLEGQTPVRPFRHRLGAQRYFDSEMPVNVWIVKETRLTGRTFLRLNEEDLEQ